MVSLLLLAQKYELLQSNSRLLGCERVMETREEFHFRWVYTFSATLSSLRNWANNDRYRLRPSTPAQLCWSSSKLQPLQNYNLIKFALIRPSTLNHDRNLSEPESQSQRVSLHQCDDLSQRVSLHQCCQPCGLAANLGLFFCGFAGFLEDVRVPCFWACFNWNLLVFWTCFLQISVFLIAFLQIWWQFSVSICS